MKGWGVLFLVLGIGSFALPMVGLQFKLVSIFGDATPAVGGVLAVLGIVMLLGGSRSGE